MNHTKSRGDIEKLLTLAQLPGAKLLLRIKIGRSPYLTEQVLGGRQASPIGPG